MIFRPDQNYNKLSVNSKYLWRILKNIFCVLNLFKLALRNLRLMPQGGRLNLCAFDRFAVGLQSKMTMENSINTLSKQHLKELIQRFEEKRPEIVFEWKDSQTEAEGWIVINSCLLYTSPSPRARTRSRMQSSA